jgi:hypothetical protein
MRPDLNDFNDYERESLRDEKADRELHDLKDNIDSVKCARCKKLIFNTTKIKSRKSYEVRILHEPNNVILTVCKNCYYLIQYDNANGEVPEFYEKYREEQNCRKQSENNGQSTNDGTEKEENPK